MNYILTIDPGITGLGYALWEMDTEEELVPPVYCGNAYPAKRGEMWLYKAYYVRESLHLKLQCILKENRGKGIDVVYIEFQEFFQGSTKSRAATTEGSIAKLTLHTGMLVEYFRSNYGSYVELVPPSKWMGNLSSHAMRERMYRRLGKDVCTKLNIRSHAVDAVCLGLWMKGYWNNDTR